MSIYNSIRSSKVSTAGTDRFASMRTFNENAMVCPARANVSDSGVGSVARDTINTATAGCYSPLNRMTVENELRPQYSSYLNASAINNSGVGDQEINKNFQSSRTEPTYDTLLGGQYIRQDTNQRINPSFQSSGKFQAAAGSTLAPQLSEANEISCIMNKYASNNCNQ